MKKILVLAMIAIAPFIYSCDDEPVGTKGCTDTNATNYNANATEDDGSCTYGNTGGSGGNSGGNSGNTGGSSSIMFWTSAAGDGITKVTMNGQTKSITKYRTSGSSPDCGTAGYATFTGLTPGKQYTHNSHDNKSQWSNTYTAPADGQCLKVKLY